jgi:Domain of unknown function (DUF4932)
MKKFLLSIYIVFWILSQSFAQNPTYSITPKVDERVELVSIVFRLAGSQEYSSQLFKQYSDAINQHFEPYSSHPIVALAIKLRKERQLGYDGVMKMAHHIGQAPSFKPTVTFTESVPEGRWGKDNAETFVRLLKDFYVKAKCASFFDKQKPLYQKVESQFQDVFKDVKIDWYEKFYGYKPNGEFYVNIGVGIGSSNYGSKVLFPDQTEHMYAVLGIDRIDDKGQPVFGKEALLGLIVHEFNHSFVNSIIEKQMGNLTCSGQTTFPKVVNMMLLQGYGSWQTMFMESLVRACVVLYLQKYEPALAKLQLAEEESRHFFWMNDLVNLLDT